MVQGARASDRLGDVARCAHGLPAHAQHMDVVWIFVIDGEVVEDVAELGFGAHLSAPHAGAADGMGPDRPVAHVEIVNVLFTDVIARQPGEIEPVLDLPFEIGHAFFAGRHARGRPCSRSNGRR